MQQQQPLQPLGPSTSVNYRVRGAGAETEESNQSFDFNDTGETEEERIARELKKAKVFIFMHRSLQFHLSHFILFASIEKAKAKREATELVTRERRKDDVRTKTSNGRKESFTRCC